MLNIIFYTLLSLTLPLTGKTLHTLHGSSELLLKAPKNSLYWPNMIGLSRKEGIHPASEQRYTIKKKRGRLR